MGLKASATPPPVSILLPHGKAAIMLSQTENLYRLQKKDLLRVGDVLADAFRHDPLWNALFAGVKDFVKKYPAFFQTPVAYAMGFGDAYAISENLEGIIAWVPGRFASMSPWRIIRSGALSYGMKIGFDMGRRMSVLSVIMKDRKEAMKAKQHIYLFILGVPAALQGRGHGTTLVRALVEQADRDGAWLYLDTETETNARWYERFGFSVAREVVIPKVNLPMWEMIREPRTKGVS
ncbi:MAG: GNAT family N-acetyltransferase [Chitinivibrionales bacterium]|nr:GNAT family N-acetyltransferase [Chitinivibrionales bacterium]